MKTLEAFTHGDGAHHGLTDLYPHKMESLQEALAAGEDFTTGWYSSKKEIQSACITVRNGEAFVEVTISIDDSSDLIDTAIWNALGRNEYAGSGYDAMRKKYPGITDEQIDQVIDEMAMECGLGEENTSVRRSECNADQESILNTIDNITDDGVEELDTAVESIYEYVENNLDRVTQQVRGNPNKA